MTETFPSPLRLGTRGSPLALAQAYEVRDRLTAAHPGLAPEIVEIKTTGDKVQDRPLSEIGGKGLFSKELDAAQRDGRCEAAVHSLKDLETWLPEDIEIAAILPREDARDAFVSLIAKGLDDLPKGATVGTASLRRQAQILAARPDLNVVTFRGNVNTRLRKLGEKEADATLLAMAGLNRLNMTEKATRPLEPEEMLPAAGQGAIAISIPKGREDLRALMAPLHCADTAARVSCERGFLAALDGSCRTPIGAYAEISGGILSFRGLLASEDGKAVHRCEARGNPADAHRIGFEAGEKLKRDAGGVLPG